MFESSSVNVLYVGDIQGINMSGSERRAAAETEGIPMRYRNLVSVVATLLCLTACKSPDNTGPVWQCVLEPDADPDDDAFARGEGAGQRKVA